MKDSELTRRIIGAAIAVHRELGPGLLEAVYEECLAFELRSNGLPFVRQQPIPVVYKGTKLDCGYRADLIVASRVIIEVKAIAAIAPVHAAVMLTYLRLSDCRIGLLVNFHSATLKDGLHRFVWNYNSDKETERRDTEVAERCLKRRFEC